MLCIICMSVWLYCMSLYVWLSCIQCAQSISYNLTIIQYHVIPACMDQDHLSKSFNIMPKIMCSCVGVIKFLYMPNLSWPAGQILCHRTSIPIMFGRSVWHACMQHAFYTLASTLYTCTCICVYVHDINAMFAVLFLGIPFPHIVAAWERLIRSLIVNFAYLQ